MKQVKGFYQLPDIYDKLSAVVTSSGKQKSLLGSQQSVFS